MKHPHLSEALAHGATDKRIEILRRIAQGGSISQAARDAGVSYKAAWQAIDTLTNLAGVALVERVVGGAGGGGAQVTQAGRQLLDTADALDRARTQVLAHAAGLAGASAALQTSMRNLLPCTVYALVQQGRIWRVLLNLGRGASQGAAQASTTLASRITQESVELLGLKPGLPVLALCKATAVTVLPSAASAPAAPGRNQLPGKASRIVRANTVADADEIAVTLEAGGQIAGFMPAGYRVRHQARVVVCMDESAVVLALDA